MEHLWDEYPMLQKDLLSVKDVLKKSMHSNENTMNKMLIDQANSNGKMLRPAFLLLAGHFGDYDAVKLSKLAAVIEMLHMATLVHDDIVDDSALRRGSPTIQSKYGKNYAVFMGDYLLTQCFMLLSEHTSVSNMKKLSKSVSEICTGEINQFSSLYSTDFSVIKYLKRIGGKTASLFSLSFYIGASESNCSKELCRTFIKIGHYLGMAFQIIDDILDYEGNEKIVGKSLGNDIKQGVFTLPLIYAFKKDGKQLSKILGKTCFSAGEIYEIISLCRESGGVDNAKSLAKKYTERAFKHISSLPEIESKDILLQLSKKLLLRQY